MVHFGDLFSLHRLLDVQRGVLGYPVLRTAKEGKCLSIDLIRGQFKGQSQSIAPKQSNTKEIECAGFICRTRLLQITRNNAPLTRCHCVWKQHRRGEPPVARLWPTSGE